MHYKSGGGAYCAVQLISSSRARFSSIYIYIYIPIQIQKKPRIMLAPGVQIKS